MSETPAAAPEEKPAKAKAAPKATTPATPARKPGAWLVYSLTGEVSEVAVFSAEIEALRNALAKGGSVDFVEFGKTIGESVGKDATVS